MGCVNSTANVQQAQEFALDPVQHEPSSQMKNARSAGRQQIRSELVGLSRPPSRTSLREGDKYQTLGVIKPYYDMDTGAAGEANAVEYFNSQQRARHEVKIQDGALFRKDGAGGLTPMDTKGKHDIFVMGGKGEVYAGDQDVVPKHSSLLGGAPVAAAGTVRVENGRLRHVTDQSGHYLPTREHSAQFVQELKEKGVTSHFSTSYEGLTKAQLEQAGFARARVYPEGVRTKRY